MRARQVCPSFFPAASHLSRLPSTNALHELSALHFHGLTKPFSGNPFRLMHMQAVPGVRTFTPNAAPLFSITSALFFHSLAKERSSSLFFSFVCALFAKTWGV